LHGDTIKPPHRAYREEILSSVDPAYILHCSISIDSRPPVKKPCSPSCPLTTYCLLPDNPLNPSPLSDSRSRRCSARISAMLARMRVLQRTRRSYAAFARATSSRRRSKRSCSVSGDGADGRKTLLCAS